MRLTVRPRERPNPSPLVRPPSAIAPAAPGAEHHQHHSPSSTFPPRHPLPHSPLATHPPAIAPSLSPPSRHNPGPPPLRSPPATSILHPSSAQFFPAPNGVAEHESSSFHGTMTSHSTPSGAGTATTPATNARPSQNEILSRIVKSEDTGIKKRKAKTITFRQHLSGKKDPNVIPPPPLSKYKKPPHIVPHRPGDRYPLGIPRKCAREDCAHNSKASVSRHCISEYVQKGARGSCIPKELRVEWCNTCYMTHRRDADYYPRVFSLLVDQLEICAKDDNVTRFITTYKDEDFTVDLIGAHEFILRIWEKWDRDGKIRRFRIIPEKYS